MKITRQHIPRGKKRRGINMVPRKITIHSTGNPRSTAQNERDYLTNPINTNSTGYHYVVGDSIVIEIAPPNERMYHAGHSVGNSTSIGIEMVETGNRDKVIANTINLVKRLQKQYGISDSNVVRHFDWTRKNCPRILNYNNWQGWINFKTLLRSDGMTDQQVRQIVKEEIEKNSKTMSNHIRAIAREEINNTSTEPSEYAKDSWSKAIQLQVTDGSKPKGFARREELVEMLFRFNDKVSNG